MPSIRNGTVHDAERISRLLIALSEEFIVDEFSAKGRAYFLNELSPTEMEKRLSGPYRFYLAEEGAELAGVAAVRETTHLYYLFVAKPFQRNGLARHLWSRVKEDCLALGNRNRFTVNASNYAIVAYEKLGFRRCEPTRERNGVLYNPMEFKVDG